MDWDDEVEVVDEDAPAPVYGPDQAEEPDDEEDHWHPATDGGQPSPTTPTPAVAAVEEDDEWGWEPDKGFPDPTNSVRIWVDEQGLPDKVRVSLNWRERLANGALGEAVTQSFLLINHFHHVYRASDPTSVQQMPPAEPLSTAERAELLSQIDALAAQLATRTPGSYRTTVQTWQPAIGTDFEDGVLVALDATGRPAYAKFDPKWLESANSRELSVGILTAFKKARANYQPPQVELTTEGRLLRRMNELTQRLLSAPIDPLG